MSRLGFGAFLAPHHPVEALAVTKSPRIAAAAANVPDLTQTPGRVTSR